MQRGFLYAAISIFLFSVAAIADDDSPMVDAFLPTNPPPNIVYATDSPTTPSIAFTHTRVIDRQFIILSAISTTAVFMDSYTTTWIGNNYRSRGPGPCTVEGGEPQLYGLDPTITRSYGIGAAMIGGAIGVSYVARKYLPSKLKWLWPSAFIYETGVSIHGFSTNLTRC